MFGKAIPHEAAERQRTQTLEAPVVTVDEADEDRNRDTAFVVNELLHLADRAARWFTPRRIESDDTFDVFGGAAGG